jgi:hypothetical protein
MLSAARWVVFTCLVLLAAQTAPLRSAGAAPAPGDAAGVRAEIDRVYDWAGYQRDLPEEAPEPPAREFTIELGGLGDTFLYGLLLIGVVGFVLWLRSTGWNPLSPRDGPVPDEATAVISSNAPRVRLGEADRSAVAGDWASAIHILLLTSIELLRRREGHEVPPAMTARELVEHARLSEPARADLAALVSAAELCHFGGRAANRSLYDQCRRHYERLWGAEQPA